MTYSASPAQASIAADLPPIGAWVVTVNGRRGQVIEHVVNRPGDRPDVARIRFGEGKHGTYQAGELKDIGE